MFLAMGVEILAVGNRLGDDKRQFFEDVVSAEKLDWVFERGVFQSSRFGNT